MNSQVEAKKLLNEKTAKDELQDMRDYVNTVSCLGKTMHDFGKKFLHLEICVDNEDVDILKNGLKDFFERPGLFEKYLSLNMKHRIEKLTKISIDEIIDHLAMAYDSYSKIIKAQKLQILSTINDKDELQSLLKPAPPPKDYYKDLKFIFGFELFRYLFLSHQL